ncbi:MULTISPECIES: hypothetical protein [unclassified Granulicatella]|uniref:hypothetical protein n=1 Tax=unclassified Granulicatella TaxID=2630493 RepID=UPI001073E1B3|nr:MULTISPECIES: hypothetical protein [unclassified Granulicatella]MBF0780584.1 hypothetical protein [Granulicatella sp. 19428wC4_WM01]TFU94893.1 hypothetical protein E4T68_05675 [Granulicatella sp. WM01]
MSTSKYKFLVFSIVIFPILLKFISQFTYIVYIHIDIDNDLILFCSILYVISVLLYIFKDRILKNKNDD